MTLFPCPYNASEYLFLIPTANLPSPPLLGSFSIINPLFCRNDTRGFSSSCSFIVAIVLPLPSPVSEFASDLQSFCLIYTQLLRPSEIWLSNLMDCDLWCITPTGVCGRHRLYRHSFLDLAIWSSSSSSFACILPSPISFRVESLSQMLTTENYTWWWWCYRSFPFPPIREDNGLRYANHSTLLTASKFISNEGAIEWIARGKGVT